MSYLFRDAGFMSALFFPEPSMSRFILPLSLCLLSHASFAADSQLLDNKSLNKAAELRDSALQKNEAYTLLESLTTEIGPRMAGSPADARAVAWAEQKFKALGYDKVILQPVTFPVWQRGPEKRKFCRPFRNHC